MSKTTIASLSRDIQTEAQAYEYLEGLRWKGTPTCAHCQGTDVYLIVPKNGTSRKTRTGTLSERRVWRCRECGKQFSVLTGTIMHRSKVSVRTWVLVYFDFMAAKNGISAREIERKYGVCPRTAWFLMHRIREAMKDDGLIATMRGTIVADETLIGGEPSRMNNKTWRRWQESHGYDVFKKTPKVPVVSLINATTGEVRSRVMPKVNGQNLRKVMSEQIDMAGSVLWTDEGTWYFQLGKEFMRHETVRHVDKQYVGANGQTTNKAENFFSQLKRSLDGTHHHVSVEHLGRYLAEFDYRYSTRGMSDAERMAEVVARTEGRRITYKRIKATD